MEQEFGILRTLRQTVQVVRADLMEVAGEEGMRRRSQRPAFMASCVNVPELCLGNKKSKL